MEFTWNEFDLPHRLWTFGQQPSTPVDICDHKMITDLFLTWLGLLAGRCSTLKSWITRGKMEFPELPNTYRANLTIGNTLCSMWCFRSWKIYFYQPHTKVSTPMHYDWGRAEYVTVKNKSLFLNEKTLISIKCFYRSPRYFNSMQQLKCPDLSYFCHSCSFHCTSASAEILDKMAAALAHLVHNGVQIL